MPRIAAQAALDAACTNGTLLKKGRGEAAFAERGKGADRVVLGDDCGAGEVDLEGCCVEGEDPCEGLAADLVSHVVRVWKGANNDFAVVAVPPAQDHAHPCKEASHVMAAMCVELVSPVRKAAWGVLGTKGHRGGGAEGVVFKDASDENHCLVDGRRRGDFAVVVWFVLRANDGGGDGHKGQHVGDAGEVVLDAPSKGG